MMILIILVELLILLWMRRYLAKVLHRLIIYFGGSSNQSIWVYSVLTLPGVALHEMAHFFMAALFGFRTGKIDLLPRLTPEGGVELGSVQVEKTDPIRLSVVGMAPFVFGIALVSWLSSLVLFPAIPTDLKNILLWYLISCISLHLFPSKQDMQTWPIVGVFLLVLTGIIWKLGITIPNFQPFFEKFSFVGTNLAQGLGLSVLFTGLVIVILGIVYGLCSFKH